MTTSTKGVALVTGAGGFIGSHLAEALIRDGWRVRALLRYTSRGSRGWLESVLADVQPEIEPVFGDIRDADSVRAAAAGCSRIYHLAALIGIPYSYHSPTAYAEVNVLGTLNVLNAARDLGDRLERLVHTSTSECYGTARVVPITEEHPLQAQSPYAATKIGADKLVESFHRSFGLRAVTLRPFNTFGPRQSMRAVIPTMVTQCLAAEVVRLGNVDPIRDFTFVADTVDAFVRAGNTAVAEGQVLNIGTGAACSVRDVLDAVAQIVGRRPRLEIEEARVRPATSEVDRLVASSGRAQGVLGWAPRHTFRDGLLATVAWIKEHASRLKPEVYQL